MCHLLGDDDEWSNSNLEECGPLLTGSNNDSSEKEYSRGQSPFSSNSCDEDNQSSDNQLPTGITHVSSNQHMGKTQVISSVCRALTTEKAPLLAFFQHCTHEEHIANLARQKSTDEDEM